MKPEQEINKFVLNQLNRVREQRRSAEAELRDAERRVGRLETRIEELQAEESAWSEQVKGGGD